MCGVAGAVSLGGGPPVDVSVLRQAVEVLRHRGPEAAGIWTCPDAALAHARLSIVDLAGGLQPIANEDESIWIVVNGEVFNHNELRRDLRARGHRFRTASDSEVILHLYEEVGARLLDQLNGQFAFALWDGRRRELMLARDRFGVRPLFFTVAGGSLLFASEIKALLVDPRVGRRPDLQAFDQVFTFWSALPGRTAFEGIRELPAGHYLLARAGSSDVDVHRYWDLRFDDVDDTMSREDAADELRALLLDATRIRLQADVPVGAYLSGGLDSSAIVALAQRQLASRLQTFSVTFDDGVYDERDHQERVATAIGTDHHVVHCRADDIAAAFPDVVWHAETPLLRTAPAPLFMLSALVRRHGLKVVLTGEGADEMFAGYDIFKEALVRRFWARDPGSALRPKLLARLYDWIPDLSRASSASYLQAYFRQGLEETADPAYSHLVRWRSTSRLKRLFSAEVRAALGGYDSRSAVDLGEAELHSWDPLSRAQYLEIRTFLSQYLLSSQGDRVAMAHSVEGRFPFLDHRVAEFASRVPPRLRLAGFDEKRVLKDAVGGMIPSEVTRRPKQPYRAPVAGVFVTAAAGYVPDLLSRDAVAAAGLFDPEAVAKLYEKCLVAPHLSESDSMALTGVVSTQLWHDKFIAASVPAVPERDDVVIVGSSSLRKAV